MLVFFIRFQNNVLFVFAFFSNFILKHLEFVISVPEHLLYLYDAFL
jgi:hypothetical protein